MKQINENGTVLISMLLLLAVVTIVSIIALNTTTVELQIMGNLKKSSMSFSSAEAGVDLSIPSIENTILLGTLYPTSLVVSGATATMDIVNLGDELLGKRLYDPDTASSSPDFYISKLNGVVVSVDVDRLYSGLLPGGSAEMASGYEGIGVSAAGGGTAIYYRITSLGM